MDHEIHEQICLSFPGVTRDIKWEKDLCYLIGEKMFSVSNMTPPLKTSFKVNAEDFDQLVDRPGIIPAPYLARYKWVAVEDPDALSPDEWRFYLKQSYDLVFSKLPKKVRQSISDQ